MSHGLQHAGATAIVAAKEARDPLMAGYVVGTARVAALCIALLPHTAWAHSQSGSLASAASATDLYEITCHEDEAVTPQSLAVRVLDTSPGAPPLVSVQVHRNLGLRNASDTITADGTPSPQVAVSEGPGVYYALVNKSGSGLKYYSLTYHCASEADGGGLETESTLVLLQDQ